MDAGLETRTVVLPSGRAARIGVVADTHSRPDARALTLLGTLAPDVLLHAGDIGDLAVLDALAPLAPALHAVRGNIDGAAPGLPDTLVLRCERDGREVVRLMLTHIAVYGPRLQPRVRRLAESQKVDLVVCGHSHVPFATLAGAVAVFNPGSIGPRRFALPIVFGLIEIGERLALRHIDCATGATWTPAPPT